MKALFLCLFIVATTLYSQSNNDCNLQLIWPNDYDHIKQEGSINPDSVMEDINPESPTYGKWFSKRHWRIQFYNNCYPFDTVLDTNEIRSIDNISLKHPTIRQRFLELQNELGTIYFKRKFIDSEVDSSWLISSGYAVILFENYQDIDYVLSNFPSEIDSLKTLHYRDQDACEIMSYKDNTENDNETIFVSPNPVNDKIYIKLKEIRNTEKIRIYSMNGQLINETDYQSVIDVSFLQDGIYYFTYNNKAYKFIKIK